MKKYLIVAAAGLFSSGAFAVEPYIQGQIGSSKWDVDSADGDSLKDNGSYYGIALGFKVNRNLAFEIGYKDFGEAKDTYNYENFVEAETDKVSLEGDAISVAVVGILPLDANFSLFGKLGMDKWHGKLKTQYDYVDYQNSSNNEQGTYSDNDSGSDFFYGVGIAYQVTLTTDVHIIYEKHSFDVNSDTLDSIDTNVLAVGVNFGF